MSGEGGGKKGGKGIESKKSRRQQSRWNVRGDQGVKEEEKEGGALRKISAILICPYLAARRGVIFSMSSGGKKYFSSP